MIEVYPMEEGNIMDNTEQLPIQPVSQDAYNEDNETTENNPNRFTKAILITKIVLASIVALFVFVNVWNNSPIVTFGLYVIPLTFAVVYAYKASKAYGTMTLLIGLSMFSFMWNHNIGSFVMACLFGGITILIYSFRKWQAIKEHESHLRGE